MKALSSLLVILCSPFCLAGDGFAAGTFSFQLKLEGNVYDLAIHETFSDGVSLEQAVRALTDPELLPKVNQYIRSVRLEVPGPGQLKQTMELVRFGVTSLLISDCKQGYVEGDTAWERKCELSTTEGTGGKYMAWKNDRARCARARDTGAVSCDLVIRGEPKGVRFLGFEIAGPQKLAMNGKYEALNNFGQVWMFTEDGSVSQKHSSREFHESNLAREIEKALNDGLTEVKAQGQGPGTKFTYSAQYQRDSR